MDPFSAPIQPLKRWSGAWLQCPGPTIQCLPTLRNIAMIPTPSGRWGRECPSAGPKSRKFSRNSITSPPRTRTIRNQRSLTKLQRSPRAISSRAEHRPPNEALRTRQRWRRRISRCPRFLNRTLLPTETIWGDASGNRAKRALD